MSLQSSATLCAEADIVFQTTLDAIGVMIVLQETIPTSKIVVSWFSQWNAYLVWLSTTKYFNYDSKLLKI